MCTPTTLVLYCYIRTIQYVAVFIDTCRLHLRDSSHNPLFYSLPTGLEGDFKVWKLGFVKAVFPVLLGEVALAQLTSTSNSSTGREIGSCECGEKRREDCCKEKAEASSEQVHMWSRVT